MGGRAFADARGQAWLYPAGRAGDAAMGPGDYRGLRGALDDAITGVVFAGLSNSYPGGSN